MQALACLLLATTPAKATDLIRATLTVTNAANVLNGTNYVINGDTRRATNTANSSGWFLTNTANISLATNIYNQLALFPVAGGVTVSMSASNALQFRGIVGGSMTLTAIGTWATVSYQTQNVTTMTAVRVPLAGEAYSTNRTNIATQLAQGLSDYSTTGIATNAPFGSNYLTLGVPYGGGVQAVISPKTFSSLSGNLLNVTNGVHWGGTNASPISSNAVNYGNALRSEGLGSTSLQLGSNALASSTRSLAVGVNALATNTDSVALGTGAKATNTTSLAVGNGTLAGGAYSIAIGNAAKAYGLAGISIGASIATADGAILIGNSDNSASAPYAIGLGFGAQANGTNSLAVGFYAVGSSNSTSAFGDSAWAKYDHSTAIGYLATTTATNQVRLGTSADTVSVPGLLTCVSGITNNTFVGTNNWNGDISFKPRSNTSLANGNNSGIILGTSNVNVRLSGATTIATLCGFAAERDGSYHIVRLSGAVTNIIANQNGNDPTVANRITTGTGGDIALTNNPAYVTLIYNGGLPGWDVVAWTR